MIVSRLFKCDINIFIYDYIPKCSFLFKYRYKMEAHFSIAIRF